MTSTHVAHQHNTCCTSTQHMLRTPTQHKLHTNTTQVTHQHNTSYASTQHKLRINTTQVTHQHNTSYTSTQHKLHINTTQVTPQHNTSYTSTQPTPPICCCNCSLSSFSWSQSFIRDCASSTSPSLPSFSIFSKRSVIFVFNIEIFSSCSELLLGAGWKHRFLMLNDWLVHEDHWCQWNDSEDVSSNSFVGLTKKIVRSTRSQH